ncbi:uncharacterized protein LOC120573949 isoform X2 [Perca fluviatilis]|uniref:uncharacterized protein LOC120573949 isoform X2 n=1 Tax=Perca fluviatilis TaxID=8168 RepID=UPI0019638567|nr:uncharacterized protein LOC120573949 isoform X2 [Perca fluviatilis]
MSAVWLKLITILCLSCTALSGPVSSEVIWRDLGEAVTIQCRPSKPNQGQEYLTLKKGLNEEYDVLYKDGKSEKNTIHPKFKGRLQLNGVFPKVDILIKNLTSNDTGPYWCVYKKFDVVFSKTLEMKGTGSVLLLVAGGPQHDSICEPSDNNLVLVIVVICAALLGIIVCFLIWIILKTKTTKRRTKMKPRNVTNNDVYEDMRGTIRRAKDVSLHASNLKLHHLSAPLRCKLCMRSNVATQHILCNLFWPSVCLAERQLRK